MINNKRLFFNWLAKNHILSQYKKNMRTCLNPQIGLVNTRSYTQSVRENIWNNPNEFILLAFTWSDTFEGREFWRLMGRAWEEYFYNYQKIRNEKTISRLVKENK